MSKITYDFELDRIFDTIHNLNAENIILQFPEGLKTRAITLADKITDDVNVNIIIDADYCYGACDLADNKINDSIDLIIHFAHTPLQINYNKPVLFVEAHTTTEISNVLKEAITKIEGNDIGIVTTTQHIHKLSKMIDIAKDMGKSVHLKEGIGTRAGQVLGCNFTSIKDISVDGIIYVGSGDFHALGIKLFTDKPVFVADPYLGTVHSIDDFCDKILKVRFARIVKAQEAKSFGIIISSKTGQLRYQLAKKLKKMIENEGFKAYILNMNHVSPDLLLPYNLDAFVSTACPRIAIDDSIMYKKPLLTPQELEIVLKKRSWEDYEMDEIVIHENQKN